MTRHQVKPPALRNRGEDQDQLHPRKRSPYALARTAAEGKVGETWKRRLECRRPAIGIEPRGLWIVPRIAMHDPLAHDHDGARRHDVAADAVLVDRAAADEPRRGIQ